MYRVIVYNDYVPNPNLIRSTTTFDCEKKAQAYVLELKKSCLEGWLSASERPLEVWPEITLKKGGIEPNLIRIKSGNPVFCPYALDKNGKFYVNYPRYNEKSDAGLYKIGPNPNIESIYSTLGPMMQSIEISRLL